MNRLLMSVVLVVSSACAEHRVDPTSIAIPDSGTFVSETGLVKAVSSCPEGSALDETVQNCGSETEELVRPTATTVVTVHYTGWTTDGVEFDSSVRRGSPASFGLHQVIAGWTEGVQTMVAGESARFWIPEELAYDGAQGAPAGILVFDVELISF